MLQIKDFLFTFKEVFNDDHLSALTLKEINELLNDDDNLEAFGRIVSKLALVILKEHEELK